MTNGRDWDRKSKYFRKGLVGISRRKESRKETQGVSVEEPTGEHLAKMMTYESEMGRRQRGESFASSAEPDRPGTPNPGELISHNFTCKVN